MMIFARIMGLFSTSPIYASEFVSYPWRIFLAFMLSLILFPVTSTFMPPVPDHTLDYFLILGSEVLIGMLIGFIISIIFASFQMAGQFFGVQIGFGYAEILDPISQASIPVISTLKNLMGMLIFLITGAHRVVLESLQYSFEHIQILTFTAQVNSGIYKVLEESMGAMFLVSFKISLPVLGILTLISIAEALMGKAAPQLNILQLSFPVRILIGLLVMFSIVPFIEKQMEQSFEISMDKINLLIKEWPKK